MQKHLAIFDLHLAQKVLSGQKTIDARFSKSKIAPFGVISTGDLVYIKPSGKDIKGLFKVKKVISYDNLDSSDLSNLRDLYGKEIAANESFWESHKDAKYGTLIFVGEVDSLITSPIKISKKDLRGWVVLG